MIHRSPQSGKSPIDLQLSANIKYVRKRDEDIRGANESIARVLEEEEQTNLYQDAIKYRKAKEKQAARKNLKPEVPIYFEASHEHSDTVGLGLCLMHLQ